MKSRMKQKEYYNLEIIYLRPDELKPYGNNARKHTPDDIDQIKDSINTCGFNDPIAIWGENNIIVEGHGRQIAAKELGLDKVPCIRLDHLTDTQRRDYAIRHNRTAELSGWDFGKLEEEIAALEIEGVDLSGLKFDLDALNGGGNPEIDIVEDEPPEPPETPIAKRGDIWQLGRHRLMCGDSTSVDDIGTLIDGQKIDLVMTDPPYGISADKMTMGTGAKEFYRGDGWDEERPEIKPLLTLADNVCIWGGNYFCNELPISNDWLVWHKKNDGLSFSECELAWTNFGCNTRHFSHHWGDEKKLHVTMKPLAVIAWAMDMTKTECVNVADLFGGSGTTLVACEQTGRNCYMMELDPHYCDVIIQRWENLTGEKAVKLN